MLLLAFLGAFLLLSGGGSVTDTVTRGARLTSSTLDAGGLVAESPASLLAQASIALGRTTTLDAYAAARMIRSEAGGASDDNKVWRLWTARNDADALGWSVFSTVTAAKGGGHVFGRQLPGRRYATSHDPYEGDLVLAERVLSSPPEYDPTGGAVKFADPGAFGAQPGTSDYADVLSRWQTQGLQAFDGPGGTVFFRRVG